MGFVRPALLLVPSKLVSVSLVPSKIAASSSSFSIIKIASSLTTAETALVVILRVVIIVGVILVVSLDWRWFKRRILRRRTVSKKTVVIPWIKIHREILLRHVGYTWSSSEQSRLQDPLPHTGHHRVVVDDCSRHLIHFPDILQNIGGHTEVVALLHVPHTGK